MLGSNLASSSGPELQSCVKSCLLGPGNMFFENICSNNTFLEFFSRTCFDVFARFSNLVKFQYEKICKTLQHKINSLRSGQARAKIALNPLRLKVKSGVAPVPELSEVISLFQRRSRANRKHIQSLRATTRTAGMRYDIERPRMV